MSWWDFGRKERSMADEERDKGRRMHRGRLIKADADPNSLIEKLKENRSRQNKGSGDAYWLSVVDVVERHYGLK